ncbi:MAG: AAA family ATPase [Chitinophagaceae bacterium]
MKIIKRTEVYHAPAEKVFRCLDDLGVTGTHMTKSSAMMMGSKLHLEYLTANHTGLDSKYSWTGTMMVMKMDFTVEVTKWVEGVEKVWETIGKAKMIIYSWYRMHLLVYPKGDTTHAELSITYERLKGWFARIVSFLFADWYCNWCLKKMMSDTKIKIENDKKILLKATGANIVGIRQTNWYVITGGPGSGKTTTVQLLRNRGYTTTIEHARHYIDTQRIAGRTVEEIRQNQVEFQTAVLNMQIVQETQLLPSETVFLDRALPDSLAYYRFLNLPEDERLKEVLKGVYYKKIFILDFLPVVNDYARLEDGEAQKKIHSLITEVYESLPFPVVHVPVLKPEERVDFILKNL